MGTFTFGFGSKLLVVTLHGQTQPVFVDLRDEGGGRWELEPPPDEDEMAEDEDEEMETIRSVLPPFTGPVTASTTDISSALVCLQRDLDVRAL